MKRFISLILALALLTSWAAAYDVNEVLEKTSQSVIEAAPEPTVSSIGGEWAVLGLSRGGGDGTHGYYEKYLKNLKEYLAECGGVLSTRKMTEYARVVLALSALSQNAADFAGFDLTLPLTDFEKVTAQGLNGAVFALLALDARGYLPENEKLREQYIKEILSREESGGGWALIRGGAPEPDITAMALTALAPYREREDVAKAIERGLIYLANAELSSCESAAQVIVAMCTLGITQTDARFMRDGVTVFDVMMSYYDGQGGFYHTLKDKSRNRMATEQALYALAALSRLENGQSALFDMKSAPLRNPIKKFFKYQKLVAELIVRFLL